MQDTKNRIDWIDVAKGIGIILVILGHTIALCYSKWIYSFHMPLFFCLSGLVYNSSKFPQYVFFFKQKVKQLLFPWLCFFSVGAICTVAVPLWRSQLTLNRLLTDLYTTNTNCVQNSSIWYLICMFMMLNLFYFIDKIKRTKTFFIIFASLALALLLLKAGLISFSEHVYSLPGGRLPLKMDTALVALVFFAVFNWYRKKLINFFSKEYPWMKIVIWGLVLFVLAVLNGWVNLNSLDFGKCPILFYPIAFFGVAFVCIISKKICCLNNDIIKKILIFYGKHSLLIFGLQSLMIRGYLYAFNLLENRNMELYANNPIQHQLGSFFFLTFVFSPIIIWGVLVLKKVVVK